MEASVRARSWLFGLLGVVIVLILATLGAQIFFEDPEYKVLREYVSPNGGFTAEESSAVWGGFGYTYCFERVVVRQSLSRERNGRSVEVYKGPCHEKKLTDEKFVRWMDGSSLQLVVYIERLDGAGYSFLGNPMLGDLKVKLRLKVE